eukprot:1155277-Pelagomonas_calceolata.AAC.5
MKILRVGMELMEGMELIHSQCDEKFSAIDGNVGAAGALFGLGAALALFYWRHKHLLKGYSDKVLRSLGITLAINLGYSLLVRNIDNWWVLFAGYEQHR